MAKKIEVDQIDQIRNIVFGKEMESYERKFQGLQKKLEAKFSNALDKIKKVESEINQQFIKESLEVNEAITQLQTDSELERSKLQQKILDFKSSQNKSDVKRDIEIKKLADEIVVVKAEMINRIEKLKTELLNQFSDSIKNIEKSYLSKADFSDVLLELSFLFSEKEISKSEQINFKAKNIKVI